MTAVRLIDPIAPIIYLLRADPDLAAEVTGTRGPRVYGSPDGLPTDAFRSDNLPLKSITVQMNGGGFQEGVPIITPQFYLTCYAPSAKEAFDLQRILYGVFYDAQGLRRCNRIVGNKWFMFWGMLTALPTPDIEEGSNYPRAFSVLRAKFDAHRGA